MIQFVCHKLLTQGPCDSDEWFVLSPEGSVTNSDLPHAVCKPRECNAPNQVMFNGKCTNVTSSDECEEANMVVLINPLGEGKIVQIIIKVPLKQKINLQFSIRRN